VTLYVGTCCPAAFFLWAVGIGLVPLTPARPCAHQRADRSAVFSCPKNREHFGTPKRAVQKLAVPFIRAAGTLLRSRNKKLPVGTPGRFVREHGK
jgi:hypothetical protein